MAKFEVDLDALERALNPQQMVLLYTCVSAEKQWEYNRKHEDKIIVSFLVHRDQFDVVIKNFHPTPLVTCH